MSTKTGKQMTKGQKQIYQENQDTLRFYAVMSGVGMLVHFCVLYFLFIKSTSSAAWFFFTVSVCIQLGSFYFMRYTAKASFNEKQQLVDAGLDLNMTDGLGEYAKDIIILSTGLQFLALIHTYFWFLFFLAPAYAGAKLWSSVISPWVFAPAAEDSNPEAEAKRMRKKEKKMVMKQR